MTRSCLWCKHFTFNAGDSDYYEGLTPVVVECQKGYWDLDMHDGCSYSPMDDRRPVLYLSFRKAYSCKDYEEDPKVTGDPPQPIEAPREEVSE